MKRSDRTPIEKAVDSVVALSMKWYYWKRLAPGDQECKEMVAAQVLPKLLKACARLERRKKRNRNARADPHEKVYSLPAKEWDKIFGKPQ